jgi:hypothetical protein
MDSQNKDTEMEDQETGGLLDSTTQNMTSIPAAGLTTEHGHRPHAIHHVCVRVLSNRTEEIVRLTRSL